MLTSEGIRVEAEPPGVQREKFMIRPTAGRRLGPLHKLQWSLADKF
jgi:hypothetical protein